MLIKLCAARSVLHYRHILSCLVFGHASANLAWGEEFMAVV